jgi:xylulokinase
MQNRLLAQIKADVYGSTLKISPIREAVSLGVALLAGIGSGHFPNGSAAASSARREEINLEPKPARAKQLQSRYEIYRELFCQLRPINHRLYTLAQ